MHVRNVLCVRRRLNMVKFYATSVVFVRLNVDWMDALVKWTVKRNENPTNSFVERTRLSVQHVNVNTSFRVNTFKNLSGVLERATGVTTTLHRLFLDHIWLQMTLI